MVEGKQVAIGICWLDKGTLWTMLPCYLWGETFLGMTLLPEPVSTMDCRVYTILIVMVNDAEKTKLFLRMFRRMANGPPEVVLARERGA